MNKKLWKGRNVAKPVYITESMSLPGLKSKEKYTSLDHYLINCPDCGAELTIKLMEDLRYPSETVIEIVHSKHIS